MPKSLLPDLRCACANLRRASRLVTQLYSDEMGETMEPAQFSLLSALKHLSGACQTPLSRALGLDKTTLSRNLRVMERNGWIEPVRNDDRRERGYRLTPAGENILTAAKPGWMRAQARLRGALEPREWETVLRVISRLTEAALAAASNEIQSPAD